MFKIFNKERRYSPSLHPKKEYENNLAQARVEAGLTIRELAKRADTNIDIISGLQNGMRSPLKLVGGYGIKPCVEKIAAILHKAVSELFPRSICEIARATFDPEDEARLLIGEYSLRSCHNNNGKLEARQIIELVLKKLTSREKVIILGMYLEGKTLEETGFELNITRERVRQIENKALRGIQKRYKNAG